MDPSTLLDPVSLARKLAEDDEDDEEDALLAQGALAGLVLLGVAERQQERIEKRRPRRLYLTRRDLLSDPRHGTPWQQLWSSQNDRAFITTMGIDVQTFRLLLDGFAPRWNSIPIPRDDVSSTGHPRLGRRSLDGAGALGLLLHYLGSAALETTLELIFAIIPTTMSRYLYFARKILLDVVKNMPEGAIRMPATRSECEELTELVCARHSLLHGAIATIDGLELPGQEAEDPETENATYSGWKATHLIKNVIIWSPKGEIIAASYGNPGSWHDSQIAAPLYRKLQELPEGYYIVADTAFPRGPRAVDGRIRTPPKAGDRLPSNDEERDHLMRFNNQLLSYRQTAEWGMRVLQGSFGRLRVPLPCSTDDEDKEIRNEILELCFRLSNVRARCVGINQIRQVYMPIWRESEDAQLWDDLGGMLFGEIRRRDRVSRFHLIPVEHQSTDT